MNKLEQLSHSTIEIRGVAAWHAANERYAKLRRKIFFQLKKLSETERKLGKTYPEELKMTCREGVSGGRREVTPTILSTNEHQDKADINDYVRLVNCTKKARAYISSTERGLQHRGTLRPFPLRNLAKWMDTLKSTSPTSRMMTSFLMVLLSA